MNPVGIKRKLHFTVLMDHIIKDDRLSKIGLLVYVAIASFSSKERVCYPSLNTIAKRAKCTRASAQKGVAELIELGYLQKEQRKRAKSKEYTSCLYTLIEEGIPQDGTPYTTERYTPIPPNGKELETVEEEKGKYIDAPPFFEGFYNEGRKYHPKFEMSGPLIEAVLEFDGQFGDGTALQIFREQYIPKKKDKLGFVDEDFPLFLNKVKPDLNYKKQRDAEFRRTQRLIAEQQQLAREAGCAV